MEGSQLREIKEYAFYNTSITEVRMPASVQDVNPLAFQHETFILRPADYRPDSVLTANKVREMLN